MKILYIISGLGMGGAEHVVVNLADQVFLKGNQVKIAYLTGDASVLPKNLDIEIISVNINSIVNLPYAYFKLRKIIKIFKPDIVHSHMFHSNILSRLLRITVKIPKLICTSHSNFEGGKVRMLAYKVTDRLASISTNVSQDAVKSMVDKGAYKFNRVVAIPNGIDIEDFKFKESSRIKIRNDFNIRNQQMILAVGRMSPAKDYPNLFRSIAILRQFRNDFIVYIVGEGPLKNDLMALAKKLNIHDIVIMLGTRYDIPDLMSASDVFVLSSAWEGFGLVVAEAMACERVVVATNCGGVKEVMGSNNNGFLVPINDSESLADKLSLALSLDKIEKSSIGVNARKHIADNFSMEANVEAYLRLYYSSNEFVKERSY